jgi:hypothetical protein
MKLSILGRYDNLYTYFREMDLDEQIFRENQYDLKIILRRKAREVVKHLTSKHIGPEFELQQCQNKIKKRIRKKFFLECQRYDLIFSSPFPFSWQS